MLVLISIVNLPYISFTKKFVIILSSCTLTWKPPIDDGGCPIIEYQIEAFHCRFGCWTSLGKCNPIYPFNATASKFPIKNLVEGEDYRFREFCILRKTSKCAKDFHCQRK